MAQLPPIDPDRIFPNNNWAFSRTKITNDTRYMLTVYYSGSSSETVVLAPHATRTVTLLPGFYKVFAEVTAPNVIPIVGSRTMQAGDFVDEKFYRNEDQSAVSVLVPSRRPTAILEFPDLVSETRWSHRTEWRLRSAWHE